MSNMQDDHGYLDTALEYWQQCDAPEPGDTARACRAHVAGLWVGDADSRVVHVIGEGDEVAMAVVVCHDAAANEYDVLADTAEDIPARECCRELLGREVPCWTRAT